MTSNLEIWRRNLPHWTMEGAWYYITFCTNKSQLAHDEILIVLEHIKSGTGKFYRLVAACVMPDHTHCILVPNENISLTSIIRGIKGPTARLINRARGTTGSLWQDERWDRIIRDEAELQEKIGYILQNPVKEGLVDDPFQYMGTYLSDRI